MKFQTDYLQHVAFSIFWTLKKISIGAKKSGPSPVRMYAREAKQNKNYWPLTSWAKTFNNGQTEQFFSGWAEQNSLTSACLNKLFAKATRKGHKRDHEEGTRTRNLHCKCFAYYDHIMFNLIFVLVCLFSSIKILLVTFGQAKQ